MAGTTRRIYCDCLRDNTGWVISTGDIWRFPISYTLRECLESVCDIANIKLVSFSAWDERTDCESFLAAGLRADLDRDW